MSGPAHYTRLPALPPAPFGARCGTRETGPERRR